MSRGVSKVSFFWCFAVFFACIWLVIAGGPFYYLIITSMKSLGEFLSGNFFKLPAAFNVDNYQKVLWNEFSFVMVLTQSQKSRTLPLAVWEYQGQYSINIPVIMAVLILSSLPIILLYIFGQDKLVKGMMAGAVKG
ncbi:hypothetical protein FACS189473_3500 [Spirochaetia bacterium]|nr:hypothetical protein FACS189473_3500 [Spirochaetia bacterium]